MSDGWAVRVVYDVEDMEQQDAQLVAAVGRQQDGSGSDGCIRDMDWYCDTAFEATAIRDLLKEYPWAHVALRDRQEHQWRGGQR